MSGSTFSGSLWHAFWVLLPLGIVVFFVCFFSLQKGSHYFFDPKHNVDQKLKDEKGDYEPHSKRYQELAKLAITLSAAAIGFLISIVASDKPIAPVFSQRVQSVAPIVCGFFGFCIATLVLFMVLQSIWYEQYCHSPDHSSYKRWKYALSTSLGWTGLLSFVLGFLWLARNLFRS
jgi:phosphate/sulfate permease